jgi:hypothetical protein
MFNEDFRELLSALNAYSVRYLIVGGYAVSFHAEPRATKDLDIWISPDKENGAATLQALVAFGAPVSGLTAADMVSPDDFFRMGNPPRMVDILPKIDGVDFPTAWIHRVEVPFGDGTPETMFFISRDDLIAAKLACGRPQDIADIAALRGHGGTEGERKQGTVDTGPDEDHEWEP